MKKRPKARWLKALRSGQFNQATQELHKINEEGHHAYCCLGVLRNIEKMKGRKRNSELLAPCQLDRVGLDSKHQAILARMNDSGKSFSEIADYIEKAL